MLKGTASHTGTGRYLSRAKHASVELGALVATAIAPAAAVAVAATVRAVAVAATVSAVAVAATSVAVACMRRGLRNVWHSTT